MSLFTNKDIAHFFVRITCILFIFLFLLHWILWFFHHLFSPLLLLLSISVSLCILWISYQYFQKQNNTIESGIDQINHYLSGNAAARLDCNYEGSFYKLFHSINTLATVLDAQATKEQQYKDFLKKMISDISHQLKTPLAALNIYNGILEATDDIAAVKEFTALSEQELDRIGVLVQNLLKIAKFDAGSIVMEKKEVNIYDMCNEIYHHFAFQISNAQKKLILSGTKDSTLFCDKDWMMEAISNLVKNAIEHTKPGNQIVVEWKHLPSILQIVIQDNGCGIHPQDIHHIFKRFYRSHLSKDTSGLGLGLPLSKVIIEAHGGNITVESMPGKGSTFFINFPNLTKL